MKLIWATRQSSWLNSLMLTRWITRAEFDPLICFRDGTKFLSLIRKTEWRSWITFNYIVDLWWPSKTILNFFFPLVLVNVGYSCWNDPSRNVSVAMEIKCMKENPLAIYSLLRNFIRCGGSLYIFFLDFVEEERKWNQAVNAQRSRLSMF